MNVFFSCSSTDLKSWTNDHSLLMESLELLLNRSPHVSGVSSSFGTPQRGTTS